MKRLHAKALIVGTLLLSTLSLPSFSQQEQDPEEPPEEPPPDIVSVTPFSRKSATFHECPDPGGGCVVTVFSDGTVTGTNVD
jgi:hypothetical protein